MVSCVDKLIELGDFVVKPLIGGDNAGFLLIGRQCLLCFFKRVPESFGLIVKPVRSVDVPARP